MSVMHRKLINVTLVAFGLLSFGCKPLSKKGGGGAPVPSSYAVQSAQGNGIDSKIDNPLVWQRNELPKCLQNRVNVKFYVWAEQKTVTCLASGAWE